MNATTNPTTNPTSSSLTDALHLRRAPARRPSEQARGSCRSQRVLEAFKGIHKNEHALMLALSEVRQKAVYRRLGCANIYEYAKTFLDFGRRKTEDMLRLKDQLQVLPELAEAFASGDLGWTKVRELGRVVTPETESEWLDRAYAVNSRTLEREVAESKRGEGPPDYEDIAPRKPEFVSLRFRIRSADAALVYKAMAYLRAKAGGEPEDFEPGAVLAEMARYTLEAAANAPKAADRVPRERFTVVLQECPSCQDISASGRSASGRSREPVPEDEAQERLEGEPGPKGGAQERPEGVGGPDGVAHEVGLVTRSEAHCDCEHMDGEEGPHQGHTKKAVPPALKRTVLHRDNYCCRVPGCTNVLWLDTHHLTARWRGGENTFANLVTLCSLHHRSVHLGLVSIHKTAAGDLRFEWPERCDAPRHEDLDFMLEIMASGPMTTDEVKALLRLSEDKVRDLLEWLEDRGQVVRDVVGGYRHVAEIAEAVREVESPPPLG